MRSKAVFIGVLFFGVGIFNVVMRKQPSPHPEFGEKSATTTFGINTANAYPPAVGILGNSKNCLTCHINNGQWKDDENTFIVAELLQAIATEYNTALVIVTHDSRLKTLFSNQISLS